MIFSYQAKNGPTEIIKGQIDAANYTEAIKLVEAKGFVPIEVAPAKAGSTVSSTAQKPHLSLKRKKVSVYEVCIFTRQMAGFLKASVPLLSALELIRQETRQGTLHQVLTQVTRKIRDGGRFSDALEAAGCRAFDTRYISMVRSGETGGSLDNILETLANYLEREEEIQGQVKTALAYPILVILVGIGTIFFLFTFCIPRLSSLFRQAYGKLPLPTKILMSFAQPGWQTFFWVLLLVVASTCVYFFCGGEKQKKAVDRFLMRVPILGQVKLKSDIARFCETLSMLIENGIPVYQAIEVTRPVLGNELLKNSLKEAQNRILSGERMTAVLRDSPHFPPFVVQMISVGEESGRLVESLREVARFYSRESLHGIKILTSLLEPAFILVLSMVVGFVVAGMMLPIFDMSWVK